jgi:hypothetical protein
MVANSPDGRRLDGAARGGRRASPALSAPSSAGDTDRFWIAHRIVKKQ